MGLMIKKTFSGDSKISVKDASIRIRENTHSFSDIEIVCINMLKTFIEMPSEDYINRVRRIIFKYVPFKQQKISEFFVSTINFLLDKIIEKHNYDLYEKCLGLIMHFYSNTAANNAKLLILEKASRFFDGVDEPKYARLKIKITETMGIINGMNRLKRIYENNPDINRDPNQIDEQVGDIFTEMSDMMLDMSMEIKKTVLSEMEKGRRYRNFGRVNLLCLKTS